MNETFDAIAWDAWRKQEIEKHGNDPTGWINVSKNLIVSGAMLVAPYSSAMVIMLRNVTNGGSDSDRPRTAKEEEIIRRGHQTHSIGLMLFAFSIECLLKALFLKRGGVLYENGRFKSPTRLAKSHNLLEIAESYACSTLFTEHQCEILDLLSARNEMGRYPVHSKYDSYGTQPPSSDGFSRFYGLWDASKSATVFDILNILYQELDDEIPSEADELREEIRVVRSLY